MGGPCVNVPAYVADGGLPVGVQVIARFGDDAGALEAARFVEEAVARAEGTLSFRGDAKHRPRNLEILRCAIAHRSSREDACPGNDGRYFSPIRPSFPACNRLI